jgi:ParB-like chromosome segregation protein Spo0J
LADFEFALGLAGLLIPIDRVRPHPENPNIGDRVAIWESICVNGFNDPIAADRSTGYIVEGNTRWATLKEHGIETIPVIWLDFDTPAAAVRYMIGHNQTNKLAEYDDRLLATLLVDLDKEERALAGTGMGDQMLTDLLDRLAAEDRVEVEKPFAKQRAGGFGGGLTSCPECGWSRT